LFHKFIKCAQSPARKTGTPSQAGTLRVSWISCWASIWPQSQANDERSHVGPTASDCKQDAVPALAGAIGWATVSFQTLESLLDKFSAWNAKGETLQLRHFAKYVINLAVARRAWCDVLLCHRGKLNLTVCSQESGVLSRWKLHRATIEKNPPATVTDSRASRAVEYQTEIPVEVRAIYGYTLKLASTKKSVTVTHTLVTLVCCPPRQNDSRCEH